MRGDFSSLHKERSQNFRGTLHQQGRVLLDRDWNAQTEIMNEWQDTAARDAFGAGVAAVPADAPESFRVTKAEITGGKVKISIKKGRIWADGLFVELPEDAVRTATYLGPPVQASPNANEPPLKGASDAVILETWLEELSPFQNPELLIEPALGGVDTTERLQTAFRLRLYRQSPGDTCDSIIDRLKDNFSKKGKLTAELTPTVTVEGDCPLVEGGGFTGFEHRLYRIEIGDTDRPAPEAYFKWSHFNGGLVGNGDFDMTNHKVTIRGNRNAIVHSGESRFYLEALEYDPDLGCWKVVYGARATLDQDGMLELPDPGSSPGDIFKNTSPASKKYFFRLWNGIERIKDFTVKKDLPDNLGIHVQFEPEGDGNYIPADFWTFEVRADGIDNSLVLVGDKDKVQTGNPVSVAGYPPQGLHYHRVPLARLPRWTGKNVKIEEIQDCRRKFPSLTDISIGCCVDVWPGEDIHQALNKVILAGGGCICLHPGDHYLSKPIDLSQCSCIHMKGFGMISRLHITGMPVNTSPFILSDSQNISFESFSIISRNGEPVWSCKQTRRLSISNMIASATISSQSNPLISIAGECSEWILEKNVFTGPKGIEGDILSDSKISENHWRGATRGIDLKYLYRSRINENRFTGLNRVYISRFEADLEAVRKSKSLTHLDLPSLFEPPVVRPLWPNIAPSYIALDISGCFDVDIIGNNFLGNVGISAELIEKCKIQANDFMTSVTAASCGLVHGLRFSENRVGQRAVEFNEQKNINCKVGLLILADATNCQVVNNSFANVQQGILFESDINGVKAVSRDFDDNLFKLERVTKESAKKLLVESETRIKTRLDKQILLNSTFFRIGKCEHTLIEGNQFYASQSGIEWSGTKNIVDFRIVNNSFIGCQDVAIQIEPDDRIFYLADPVDTKVRLIEKNRFDIYSGAVRSTIGAVRVEKNDIRIKPPKIVPVPPIDIMVAVAENIYRSATYTKAAKASDVPMMRMMTAEFADAVEKNPEMIDAGGFSKQISKTILEKHNTRKDDIWADRVFALKMYADISANKYLVAAINTDVSKVKLNIEGYAVNLSGIQNRAVHNRIYGKNLQRPGGIIFHVVSGEVRDNEVSVPSMALLLNGRLGLSGAYKGAEIVGNSLTTSGIPGKTETTYALAIPSLSPGNLSITNNQFKGSVMVGGDPISAQGLTTKEKYRVANEVIHFNVMKFDMPTYSFAAVAKAFPSKIGEYGVIEVPEIVIPIWLLDPHADRPVVQFSNNRLVQGWLGIFQAISGAYWSKTLLRKYANKALVANLSANVMDYGGSVVGRDVIIVGNQSQLSLKYRAGNKWETMANIPEAQSF